MTVIIGRTSAKKWRKTSCPKLHDTPLRIPKIQYYFFRNCIQDMTPIGVICEIRDLPRDGRGSIKVSFSMLRTIEKASRRGAAKSSWKMYRIFCEWPHFKFLKNINILKLSAGNVHDTSFFARFLYLRQNFFCCLVNHAKFYYICFTPNWNVQIPLVIKRLRLKTHCEIQ